MFAQTQEMIRVSFNTDDGIRRATMPELIHRYKEIKCFNTDDGIRRATIRLIFHATTTGFGGFNTDDGIRRATIRERFSSLSSSRKFQYR